MMPAFRDHFAFASESYASFRPHYPDPLFDWLASRTPQRERAWDCGTGTGQAAVALARHYGEVLATDPSMAQLASATPAVGVRYVAMSAEHAALATRSTDLVTVAQALHWFDRPAFFNEVDRVLRPGGALAVWSYGLVTSGPAIDLLLGQFYHDELGPYWPRARALVDSGYAGIELPYREVDAPVLSMEAIWTLRQFTGYLSTWSAVGRYRAMRGTDPLPEFMRALAHVWGDADSRRVCWPLVIRICRKPM